MNRTVLAIMILCCLGCSSAPRSVETSQPGYPNGLTASEVFDLRTKCAKMVDEQADTLGGVGAALASQVSSHYNPNTNRCYAEIVNTKNFSYNYKEHPVPDNYRTTSITDAQTMEQLVFADQEGEKSYAIDEKTMASLSYDQGIARINQLMQDDAQ